MADDEFLWEFLVESYENLDNIDSRLVALESAQDADSVAAIFRSMHTIKGTSGFFGFSLVERVGHVAENLLGRIRDGELSLTSERASALLASTDALRALFAGIEASGNEPNLDISELVDRLATLTTGETAEPSTVEAEAEAEAEDEVEFEFDAAVEIEAEDEVAHVEAVAAAEAADSGDFVLAAPATQAATKAAKAPKETKASKAAGAAGGGSSSGVGGSTVDVAPTPAAAANPAAAPASKKKEPADNRRAAVAPRRGDDDRTGELLIAAGVLGQEDLRVALAAQAAGDKRVIGEILVSHGWVEASAVESVLQLQRQLRQPAEPKSSAEDSTIRLDVSVLDELMNLVGELVLARNSLVRSISTVEDRSLLADSQRIDLVTSELQARVLRTRMRPIRTVWAKLPRLVREVSMTCGRQVALVLEGEETELDKSVVEAIKDPLTHCVRNAVDHGIESPEDRIAAGKRAEGTLSLKASHENGQVVIQIKDDGRGIDVNKIRAKASEKNIHPEDVLARMTEREILDLIFAPGFSTAAKVTEVSGRGVGMDVVRTNIERIGGSVNVTTVLGEGSTFTFMIPLTLAIIPALLVTIGSHRYAIPQTSLVELVRLTGDDCENSIENMHGVDVYRLRGRLLPVIDAATTLGVPHPPPRPGRRRLQIAVLQADGREFGLVVDDVHGTEEIVVKPVGPHYTGIGCFAGATILGDGVVSLIVDVAGVAERAGVGAATLEDANVDLEQTLFDGDGLVQYVIVSMADGSKYAVPLDQVARLEKFTRDRVEEVAGNRVVQYRDGLLPLTTIGGWYDNHERPVVTAVLHTSLGEIGLVVDRVLDVATGSAEAGGTITVTDGRAHEIVDVEQLIYSCRHLLAEAHS
ncbi:MAG: chemotaxis protein CheA [Actinobacteria bacterium]|nr:chemotaxis protein CheA [Actinomycetota bacterium]